MKFRFTLLYHTPPLRVYIPPCPHTLYQTITGEGLAMRRNANREARSGRLLSALAAALLLAVLAGVIHGL